MAQQRLAVRYDASLPILVVRPGIWSAATPSRWFDNYVVVCAIDNPVRGRIKTFDIRDYYLPSETPNRQLSVIYRSDALQRLIVQNHLQGYRHIASNNSFGAAAGYPLIGGQHALARSFEDKVGIRKLLGTEVSFPPYRLIPAGELELPGSYAALCAELASRQLVLQAAKGSGSRGTFFAGNADEFATALEGIQEQANAERHNLYIITFLEVQSN